MVLELMGVEKSYRGNKVLCDVSLNIHRGEILAVIGHSGAGKTTLLRCINALEACDKGSINIDGTYLCKEENGKVKYAAASDLKLIRKKLGMVFQNYNLFPHKSVMENIIEAPVNVYKIPRAQAERDAYELMEKLGLKDKANSYPCQLSGGQKQRVAIARACILNPSIMCFDEPTSALDPELKEGIALTMQELASENIAVLVITHDMSLAKRVADRIIFMEEGKVVQVGTKEEFFADMTNERVKRFILSAY